jgi:hypothetical protein
MGNLSSLEFALYELETSVPMPSVSSSLRDGYLLHTMNVGESFRLPTSDVPQVLAKVAYLENTRGWRFAVRKSVIGYRAVGGSRSADSDPPDGRRMRPFFATLPYPLKIGRRNGG